MDWISRNGKYNLKLIYLCPFLAQILSSFILIFLFLPEEMPRMEQAYIKFK